MPEMRSFNWKDLRVVLPLTPQRSIRKLRNERPVKRARLANQSEPRESLFVFRFRVARLNMLLLLCGGAVHLSQAVFC
jgi:hypothetical protein